MKFSTLVLLLLSHCLAWAEDVRFDDEELSKESVNPRFVTKDTLKNRNIVTEGKFDIGLLGGRSLAEPFYEPYHFGIGGSYHFDEVHGINVGFTKWQTGLSTNGKTLFDSSGFDVSKASAIDSILLVNYQVSGYYGKISLTKQTALNLHIFGLLGAGLLNYEGGGSFPALSLGFGQKFYLNQHFHLRFDIRLMAYHGPDTTSKDLRSQSTKLKAADMDKSTQFASIMDLGLGFLF